MTDEELPEWWNRSYFGRSAILAVYLFRFTFTYAFVLSLILNSLVWVITKYEETSVNLGLWFALIMWSLIFHAIWSIFFGAIIAIEK